MGYTGFTKHKIESLLPNIKSVMDLGAQNDFSGVRLDLYISEWYKSKLIAYECIDLNGENGAWEYDLAENWSFEVAFDLVVDAGTSEHVGKDGAFSWLALYNCWKNKHYLTKVGGYMYNENPRTENWPGHGFNYYTMEFYMELARLSEYEIIELGKHPAMNNTTDGWNIYCIMRKKGKLFPTYEQFIKMDIRKQ